MTDDRNDRDNSAQSANLWSTPDAATEYQVGDDIGPYVIEEIIGEGGYGMVYRARQTKPVQREVALKILKLGMDSRQVVARFEAERQALAMMNHASVAKVFDAGQTPRGRPFFAMEYVPGVPVTQYCDEHRLCLSERLALFSEVCEAVQHAHTKGVVHRDLKPGNILVMNTGGRVTPKVIDFGVAKALHTKLSHETIFTVHGQLLGTPEYMSPEQAEMVEHQVDTRSDIYSLGVVLYELLTGLLPFDFHEDESLMSKRRIVSEADPPRPTARLRADAQARQRARCRTLDPKSHLQHLRGDLEWIVMRCIEKDPARRYATADALVEDIRRHQNNEPVSAGPPSASYRLGKFARRHRSGVLAAAMVILALVSATIVSVRYAVRESQQRQLAQASEREAIEQAGRALAAEAVATERADELRLVAEFQSDMLRDIDVELMGTRLREDILDGAMASWSRAKLDQDVVQQRLQSLGAMLSGVNFTTTAVNTLEENVLARSLATIQQQFESQPIVQASLLESLASTYCQLGINELALAPRQRALELRRQELGERHPLTMAIMHNLGQQYNTLGQYDESVAQLKQVIKLRSDVLGPHDAATMQSRNELSMALMNRGDLDEAESIGREVLALRQEHFGDEHEDTLSSLDSMGAITAAQGRISDAETLYRRALHGRRRVLGDDHQTTLVTLNNLARTLRELGQYQEAEQYLHHAMDTLRRLRGDDHPHTLHAINNFGRVLREQRRLEEAEQYYREAMNGFIRVLGPSHPNTLVSINNMGLVMRMLGRQEEAEMYYRQALAGRKDTLGMDHIDTLTSLNNMGRLLQSQGRLAEAESYIRATLDGLRRIITEEHPNLARATANMGLLLRDMEQYEDAEPFLREAVQRFQSAFEEPHHAETVNAMNNLANLLRQLGKLEEAEEIGREVVRLGLVYLSPDHIHMGFFLRHHALSLMALKRFEEAEQRIIEAHRIHQARLGDEHQRTVSVARDVADLYIAWDELKPGHGYAERAMSWLSERER